MAGDRRGKRRAWPAAGRLLGSLLLCLASAPAWAGEATTVQRQGDAIVYRGHLDAQANARVGELLQDGGVRWLRITSGGGDINLGMDLGERVRAHGLDVHVVDYCASSCANYVFPAGARKRLPADALVVWHGSAIQQGVDDPAALDLADAERQIGRPLTVAERNAAFESLRAYGQAARQRQAAFFARIGVDARVTVFGQEVGCDCEWTLAPEDMARFGITGVQAEPGYGSHRPRGQDFALLRLADHPAYAAAVDATRAAGAATE